jgi:hypothetical protein
MGMGIFLINNHTAPPDFSSRGVRYLRNKFFWEDLHYFVTLHKT